MKNFKNLNALLQENPAIATLYTTETFTNFFASACKNCACKNYCTRKALCCYLHKNNLPITERFICRLEKLYQVQKFFVENASINEHLGATESFTDLFRESFPSLRAGFYACKDECKDASENYTLQMVTHIFKDYLERTDNLKIYTFIYGEF